MEVTKEEIIAKYKDVPCKFSSYWKYTFYFRGTSDTGDTVIIGHGGSSDDIYKFSVVDGQVEYINDTVDYINILDKDGNTIFQEWF